MKYKYQYTTPAPPHWFTCPYIQRHPPPAPPAQVYQFDYPLIPCFVVIPTGLYHPHKTHIACTFAGFIQKI
ncbi:hypothetical protein C7N43_16235 [Sphingobacteriales bacterium UPWRP_1]|nr:hypothetical protein B6N25_02600 [Sphingobacteriales bacterium TSM_CSS]PSJ75945.1 hypothetical protein C7N43_16235 [Sphingobacteriales bacterium UPWRP_1]